MTDNVKRPGKFYPYYKVAFLTDGGDRGTSYFSYPENLQDENAFGALAANIEITKSEHGVLGSLAMRIYNLSPNHRKALFKEPYHITPDEVTDSFKRIWVQCGYLTYNNGRQWLNWIGDIYSAYSYKQGDNVVTEIIANQKGFILSNAFIQLQIDQGMTLTEIIKNQMSRFIEEADYTKDIKKKAIEAAGENAAMFFVGDEKIDVDLKDDFKFEKPKVLNDTIYNALAALVSYAPNARVSIRDGKFYVSDEPRKGDVEFVINAESGLQATPRIFGERISLTTMFEPELDVASKVRVESLIEPNITGNYSVLGYSHVLTLGEGTRASAVTNLNLQMEDINEFYQ